MGKRQGVIHCDNNSRNRLTQTAPKYSEIIKRLKDRLSITDISVCLSLQYGFSMGIVTTLFSKLLNIAFPLDFALIFLNCVLRYHLIALKYFTLQPTQCLTWLTLVLALLLKLPVTQIWLKLWLSPQVLSYLTCEQHLIWPITVFFK